jgi:hypothetical protein
MPNHFHLLHAADLTTQMRIAASAFARWRNAWRGESGSVWEELPPVESIDGEQKIRRMERYIHLNPCRAHLATDPLEWPFSTHRDAVGLALDPVRRPAPDTLAYHAYTSADSSVAVGGSELPGGAVGDSDIDEVLAAMSALSRVPVSRLRSELRSRRRAVAAVRALTTTTNARVAAAFKLSDRSVRRVPPLCNAAVVRRVIGDWRFTGLVDGSMPWRSRRFVRVTERKSPDLATPNTHSGFTDDSDVSQIDWTAP